MGNPFRDMGISDDDLADQVQRSAESKVARKAKAKEVEAFAKSIAPKRTGNYAAKIHTETKGDKERVIAGAWYSHFIEYGTGPDTKTGSKFGSDTPTPEFAVFARTAAHFGGTSEEYSVTIDVLGDESTDAEELLIAWLTPLGHAAFQRRSGDPLPSRVVRHVAGTEDLDVFLDSPVVSVHTFCDANDPVAALDECKRTHQRILYLARHLDAVQLLDGSFVAVEDVACVEKPIWVDYQDDQILRKVGRYQLGLTLVTT